MRYPPPPWPVDPEHYDGRGGHLSIRHPDRGDATIRAYTVDFPNGPPYARRQWRFHVTFSPATSAPTALNTVVGGPPLLDLLLDAGWAI